MHISREERIFFHAFSRLFPETGLKVLLQEYKACTDLLELYGNDPLLLGLSWKIEDSLSEATIAEKRLLGDLFNLKATLKPKPQLSPMEKVRSFIDLIEGNNGTVDGTDISSNDLMSAFSYLRSEAYELPFLRKPEML
ncbi:hypothetical protein BXY85_1689 [Roseivirga pacifica]|jgi:hypothetical protein|uniref:Uncharacterized protein n=1 Tax=Roseivirga pacifica TaxID=1267423 RepID=A0A1I0MUC9_9BACT|nr:hypothetical protein [Roseivirga pacifica]MCO6359207.1 hypothetical protein [Roseivirga pacifica]MCO6365157.1 hypothetical protein [Roseivirga pacifica]MCO6372113.1 hypothetical protein [Roseivirga pacifica]MCO6375776.1 hypothetical protein [Roseivirga pacifica]MCO6379491.1 hypothetical protein [Roseivirga pacifica]